MALKVSSIGLLKYDKDHPIILDNVHDVKEVRAGQPGSGSQGAPLPEFSVCVT